MKTTELSKQLNKFLKVKEIEDASKNGLQIKSKDKVTKIGFAVDACIDVFQKAKKKGCDLVIVHHGLLWEGMEKDTIFNRRVNYLKKNKISLYGVHLPLDRHPVVGNNAELYRILGISKVSHTNHITVGHFPKPIKVRSFVNSINKKLKTKSTLWKCGKDKIKTVSIVSGRGDSRIPSFIGKTDCFLTGEIKHDNNRLGEEGKLNLIASGHYKTETVGPKALMKYVQEKYNIPCVFIDSPTGL